MSETVRSRSTFNSRKTSQNSFPQVNNEFSTLDQITPIKYRFPKKYDHNKKINEYMAYVNATFNSGVYNHPMTS